MAIPVMVLTVDIPLLPIVTLIATILCLVIRQFLHKLLIDAAKMGSGRTKPFQTEPNVVTGLRNAR